MHYTDIFFDFDDTLYDTYGNAVIALRETFDYYRLDRYFPDPQVFYDAYWAANIDLWTLYAKGEITRDYLIVERFRRPLSASAALAQRFGYDELPDSERIKLLELSDRFLDYCASKPGVVEGARELLDYLRSRGYRMHLCSNGFHEVQYRKLQSSGLTPYFDHVVLSEDAGANKPSPVYFDYAFRVTGAQPASTIMIGDNINTDIRGARDAGIDTIFYSRFPADEHYTDPTFTVTALRQIADLL